MCVPACDAVINKLVRLGGVMCENVVLFNLVFFDFTITREGLMGVGDRVASVIMLTLQRCPAPMLTQLV